MQLVLLCYENVKGMCTVAIRK